MHINTLTEQKLSAFRVRPNRFQELVLLDDCLLLRIQLVEDFFQHFNLFVVQKAKSVLIRSVQVNFVFVVMQHLKVFGEHDGF